ncbi:MAG TPA: lytic transglycosylase domain-containing protein [Nocardioidaceae bacterium]|nr:lytic transglycosylase domain-containing protein [Nocardioidaceae bacterium]
MATHTWHKASALVPLALLSGGWTVSLAVTSAGAAPEAAALPDNVPPAEAIEAPASQSRPVTTRPVASSGGGIPAAALSAYQRAAHIIDGTDPGCRLTWPVLAAIGRVESDHGRYGGSVLSQQGVATPGIYGVPLTGSNGTARIEDTDAGLYDDDGDYDRAVGPMQFIPSTWSVVGVDGDGDQKRDPQDVDDAALAAAVYLCSGKEDLSTESGLGVAVYRYNHSYDYVSLVKSTADGYADGSYTTVPTNSYAQVSFGPSYTTSKLPLDKPRHPKKQHVGETKPDVEVRDLPAAPTPAPQQDAPKATAPKPAATLPEQLEETVAVVEELVADVGGLVAGLLQP